MANRNRKYYCDAPSCGKEFLSPEGLNAHFKTSGHSKDSARVVDVNTGEVYPLSKGRPNKKSNLKKEPPVKPPEFLPLSHKVGEGTPTDNPPPKYLMIGTLRMPYEDWGYSSAYNLLLIAQTYTEFKTRYNYEGKVGDFCAEVMKLFRRLAGYDIIGGEYEPIPTGIIDERHSRESQKAS